MLGVTGSGKHYSLTIHFCNYYCNIKLRNFTLTLAPKN